MTRSPDFAIWQKFLADARAAGRQTLDVWEVIDALQEAGLPEADAINAVARLDLIFEVTDKQAAHGEPGQPRRVP
jgi:hypothetical protein